MIKVELTNHMKLTHVSDKQREKIIDDLTFTNPAYENAVKFSRYQHVSIPKNITYYFDEEGELWVPRGYSIPFDYEIVKDERIDVNVDYPKFRVKLWGTQREAVLAYLRRDNSRDGVIVMPTGKGKSVTAIYLASHLKQKTLVIVQKDDLIDGWKQDIKRCLGLRPVEIGLIKGKVFRIGDQITLCTIQTLSKLDEEQFDALTTNFGLVVLDECHHAAAKSYDIVSCFYARHKIALTATPYRSDNLDDVLFLYFGGIVFEYEEQEEDDDIIAAKNVNIKTVSVPEASYNPERTYYSSRLKKYLKVSEFYQYLPENIKKNPDARKSVFLKRLIDQKFFGECKLQPLSIDEIRKAIIYNDFFVNKVVGDVQAAFAFGKSIVVFCHEKEQCRLIHRRLEMIGIPLSRMQLFYGDSKISKEETKRKAESKEVLITIATFSIATEGTNIRPWESAFFAGTIANKKDLIQCIGRLRRKYPGKESVTIFDYAFPNVASARNHQNFRLKIYNEIGFNVR